MPNPSAPSEKGWDPEAPGDERIEFWGNVPFVLLHAGCLLVFWTGVSRAAIAVFFLTLVPRMFGLTAGYHRYFSHKSFKTSRVFQFMLGLLGASSLQKDPMWWAAHHRNHHRYADTELDSHPPLTRGFFWAHMGWFMCKKNANLHPDPLVPDLAAYPELVFLNRHQKIPAFVMLGSLMALGCYLQYAHPGLHTTMGQIVTWGFFISTVFLHHVTFMVNSVSHLWGPRRFQTKDFSRNNAMVAFLTMGEGWHNNHHRYPSSERQGFYWWEMDMTHYVLTLLSWFGIVWDLRKPPREIYEEAKRGARALKNVASMAITLLLCGATAFAAPEAPQQAGTKCVDQRCFSEVRDIGGTQTPLRGVAKLDFLRMDLYTAAFYAPNDAASSDQVLGDVPKALVIEYHRGIKTKWMNEAAEKTLKKNPKVNLPAIQERVDQIAAAYKKVEKGDRYELVYEPGKGTSLYLNGNLQVTIPGEDFAAAYFGIWVSDYPAKKSLRDKLLNSGQGAPKA
jgi:stearoyl-CoA desaturase (delta-9 desaturase)